MDNLEPKLRNICEYFGISKVMFIEDAIKEKVMRYLNADGEFNPRKALTDNGEEIIVLDDSSPLYADCIEVSNKTTPTHTFVSLPHDDIIYVGGEDNWKLIW